MTTAAPLVPSLDRAIELLELSRERAVIGWADNGILHAVPYAQNFSTHPDPQRTHEDAVIVIAFVPPHPDEMTLAEVVSGQPPDTQQATLLVGKYWAKCSVCGAKTEGEQNDFMCDKCGADFVFASPAEPSMTSEDHAVVAEMAHACGLRYIEPESTS